MWTFTNAYSYWSICYFTTTTSSWKIQNKLVLIKTDDSTVAYTWGIMVNNLLFRAWFHLKGLLFCLGLFSVIQSLKGMMSNHANTYRLLIFESTSVYLLNFMWCYSKCNQVVGWGFCLVEKSKIMFLGRTVLMFLCAVSWSQDMQTWTTPCLSEQPCGSGVLLAWI